MLILEMCDSGDSFEVLSDDLPKNARPGAVQDTHPRAAHLYGVVDKVGNGLNSFIGTHASHVDFLFEVELFFPHIVRGFYPEESCFCILFFDLAFTYFFQAVYLDCRFQHAECHSRVVSLYIEDFSNRGLPFQPYRIARGNRRGAGAIGVGAGEVVVSSFFFCCFRFFHSLICLSLRLTISSLSVSSFNSDLNCSNF